MNTVPTTLPKPVTSGASWVSVRYNIGTIPGEPFDDTFNVRVADEKGLLTDLEKIALLFWGVQEIGKRFPDFELQKPQNISDFIMETKGDGVIWFSRKK